MVVLVVGLVVVLTNVVSDGEPEDTTTTGLLAPPFHQPTTTLTTIASAGPGATSPPRPLVRPPVEGAVALGSTDLTPSGLQAVAVPTGVRELVADVDGVLWWTTDGGIGWFDPESDGPPVVLSAADDPYLAEITVIAPAVHGGVWLVGGDGTLRRFDGGRFVEVIQTPEPLCGVADTPELGVWAVGCGWGDTGWLWVWTGLRWSPDPEGRPLPGAAHLAVDADGRVWVANRGLGEGRRGQHIGVSRYDGSAWRSYTFADDRSRLEYVRMIAGDVSGDVWVGTPGDVARFADAEWMWFEAPEPETGVSRIDSIIGLGDRLWAVDTDNSRTARFDGNRWWNIETRGDAASNLVVAAGEVWIGIDGALHRYDGTGWQPTFTTTVLPTDRIVDSNALGSPWSWQITAVTSDEAWLLAEGRLWVCETMCDLRADTPPLIDVIVGSDGAVWALAPEDLLRLGPDGWTRATSVREWVDLDWEGIDGP